MKKLLMMLTAIVMLLCVLPAMAEGDAAVPADLVGEWHGTGTPKKGGPSIGLTARIEADGSGEYTFVQSDYTENYPFTISSDDSAFSVDIPADNYLGISECGGTWTLEDGILKLDITTTFISGGSYSYTAECEKIAEEEVRAGEPEFEFGGDVVKCPDSLADFEFRMFTNDIGFLTAAYPSLPGFANGCEMLVRLAPVNGTITRDEFMAIKDSLRLRAPSGTEVTPFVVVTDAEEGSEDPAAAFDIIYHSEEWHPLEDWDFLCGGVLYSLAGLPDNGEPLQLKSTEPTEEITEEATPEPATESNEVSAGQAAINEVLAALNDDTYRTTYDALLAGEVIQKGSKGDTAKGLQQTLVAFGQEISVDGNVGPKTIAALNAVQKAFGLEETETLDAEGYALMLPGLLAATNPDEADALLAGQMDDGEYDYMRACALAVQGRYASARTLFEESGWGDWESRAGACVQTWPKTGVLYKNPNVEGSSTELTVQFNTDPDTAMLVKIYTIDDVLARTMFIGGTGKATCSLPAGTYVIKDGTGHDWYGEEESFGSEGHYEIMTFGNGVQEVQLEKNYSSTITVNVQENNPDAEGVGADWESWRDF